MAPLTVLVTVVALLVGGRALFLDLLRLGLLGVLAVLAAGAFSRAADALSGDGGGHPGPGSHAGSRPAWLRRAGA
jgi:hypothetical protein